MKNTELNILSQSLLQLVSMFANQVYSISTTSEAYTEAEKSSLYVVLDAIKAQTILVSNELDKI